MHYFTVSFILILFCISCSSDNSPNQATSLGKDSLVSIPLDEEEFISSEEDETMERACFITNITEENGQWFIYADYIIRIDGERAIEEAKKRGDADTILSDGNMNVGGS